MSARLLDEQVAYYRARAEEYDATAYPQGPSARDRIAATVADLRIAGRVLELACGTGMWTAELARKADVTAVDASPETIAVARRRCPAGVRFEIGDLFTWETDRRFDVVFFAFWLSHVPSALLDDFVDRAAAWVASGGQLIFVDEPTRGAAQERLQADGTAVRTLNDGSTYRIVKHFLDPLDVAARLARLGWTSQIANRGDWLIGQAQRR